MGDFASIVKVGGIARWDNTLLNLARSTGTPYLHKTLLPPDTRDYIAILLAFIFCAISAGGGIGGGGLLLPMLILLLAFSPHDASPLSNVSRSQPDKYPRHDAHSAATPLNHR